MRWLLASLLTTGLILVLIGAPSLAAANTVSENTSRLQMLRSEIKVLRSELNVDRQHQQGLQAQLRTAERHMGKVTALLRELNSQLGTQKRELKKLRRQQNTLDTKLQSQRIQLVQQVRAAYAIGQQEYLKVLLNQQEPTAVARTLTYYDYFHRARLQRMQALNSKLSVLKNVRLAVEEKSAALERNRQEQSIEKESLQQTRLERARVLAKLEHQIDGKNERLQAKLEDQKRLQGLLNRLADEAIELQTEQAGKQTFAKLRGKLPWPTHGRLAARYGQTRKEGNLKWQGVLITSAEGNEVRAISHGRIAFSDWLRGFGLLTIIDHGDGYMSLYGGNQSLYKEVGDWVGANELIASVGNSGGRQQSALYFEIRHNGKPTNPLKWCKNKPKQVARH